MLKLGSESVYARFKVHVLLVSSNNRVMFLYFILRENFTYFFLKYKRFYNHYFKILKFAMPVSYVSILINFTFFFFFTHGLAMGLENFDLLLKKKI
jgi:hypothetical protein